MLPLIDFHLSQKGNFHIMEKLWVSNKKISHHANLLFIAIFYPFVQQGEGKNFREPTKD